jgi:hypothetical protein
LFGAPTAILQIFENNCHFGHLSEMIGPVSNFTTFKFNKIKRVPSIGNLVGTQVVPVSDNDLDVPLFVPSCEHVIHSSCKTQKIYKSKTWRSKEPIYFLIPIIAFGQGKQLQKYKMRLNHIVGLYADQVL